MAIDFTRQPKTSATTNNTLSKLMQNMDELQITRRPLAPHAVVKLGDEDKKLYATMLAVLLVNQTINDAQTRLLQLLLNSMQLEIPLSTLYERVANFDKAQLEAFCQLCDIHNLAPSFFMDALILCRLDKNLSEEQIKSLAELATLLHVNDSVMKDILHLSTKVLQHEDKEKSSVVAMAEAKVALSIDFDYDTLQPWHEFSYQVLTSDHLDQNQNLNDKNWLILDNLETNIDLEINNASLIFTKNAYLKIVSDKFSMTNSYLSCPSISTIKSGFSLNFNHVQTLNGVFNIHTIQTLNIKNSHFFSNENVPDLPVFTIKDKVGEKVDLSYSQFEATNRGVLVLEGKAKLDIDHCVFENCGNGSMNNPQGAITFAKGNESMLTCCDTQFKNEVARFAQTIYVCSPIASLTLIFTNCKFINRNKSLETWKNFAELGSSLYSNYESYNIIILENCLFTNTNIYVLNRVGPTWDWNSKTEAKYEIRNCTLENSAVISVYDQKDILVNSKIKNDSDKPAFIKLES